jgi:rsbT co-antagonist protein RsbR
MNTNAVADLLGMLAREKDRLTSDWVETQLSTLRSGALREAELREQCDQFLDSLIEGLQSPAPFDIEATGWESMRDLLTNVSRSRAQQDFSPSETATFVFSLKQTLFRHLFKGTKQSPADLLEQVWAYSELLDKLGLFTTVVYQQNREEVIENQSKELLELSTPVVELWDGILAVPLIGTLDSARTQIVMESLLTMIVKMRAPIAIIDITGVPTVDTLVAQHLLKTVAAARLMGADCIVSGIRPQIAQTIVHLGVDLTDVTTKATLADALSTALRRLECTIVKHESRSMKA